METRQEKVCNEVILLKLQEYYLESTQSLKNVTSYIF